jgi:hypothetical protein
VDLDAAVAFTANHARLLDRRRMQHLLGLTSPESVLTALDAYRNPDGGYGWGLEPDLRSVTSQPAGAMHALEVLAEIRDTSQRPLQVFEWLAGHTHHDGGVPFALPFADTGGSATLWASGSSETGSLQMTAQLAAQGNRLARQRADVAAHPWLTAATWYCLKAIERIVDTPQAYELMFSVRLLDAAAAQAPRAGELLERLSRFMVLDGPTPVVASEVLHPLDFSPYADAASRALFGNDVIGADLDRLDGSQRPDGGWDVSFTSSSPVAALEWRGYATVQAVSVLRGGAL